MGTVPGRGGWANGMPPVEGVLVNTKLEDEPGGGVLVSPTRAEREETEASANGARTGGGSGSVKPRYSSVLDHHIKNKSLSTR